MTKYDTDLQNAIKDIAGFWYNPSAKTSYCFHLQEGKDYSQLYLRQEGLKTSIRFAYRIIKDNEGLILEIDGEKFQLEKITSIPKRTLSFVTANKHVVELVKEV
ncbi:MAG TPA: hypothetical protein VN958_12280 [Chitinophagaceae bacterium]|nr:hypothetical protein [Chitinophagaceae bacterium]